MEGEPVHFSEVPEALRFVDPKSLALALKNSALSVLTGTGLWPQLPLHASTYGNAY